MITLVDQRRDSHDDRAALWCASMPRPREAQRAERHETLLSVERELWSRGAVVAGLDEVGAGPWAGPVTAGCVVLDPDQLQDLIGVDDSKKLTPKQRIDLAAQIKSKARAFAVAEVSSAEIDRLNIRVASMLAMERALELAHKQLPSITHLLVDAHALPTNKFQQRSIPHGDARSLSIAAASILAKVDRDARMLVLAARYPHHGFDRHMGYGTAEHRRAIEAHGLTPEHRRSFEPIRAVEARPEEPAQRSLF